MKKLFVPVFLALSVLFASAYAAPKPSVEPEVAAEVPQQGYWADGTTILWLCTPGMKGKIRVMIVTPDGQQYPAELDCVSPTSKQI